MAKLTPLARALRNNATAAERRLWRALRREQVLGFRFRRQVALGDAIADFACFEARLVVEVDGATHSSDDEIARDVARAERLRRGGWTLVRFGNDEVFRNLDGVVETILRKLQELRPRIEEGWRDPPP